MLAKVGNSWRKGQKWEEEERKEKTSANSRGATRTQIAEKHLWLIAQRQWGEGKKKAATKKSTKRNTQSPNPNMQIDFKRIMLSCAK